MVPRPRPEDLSSSSSLFGGGSPDEKPFLHDSRHLLSGRGRRRSSLLLLSGWNNQQQQHDDVAQYEEEDDTTMIELMTMCTTSDSCLANNDNSNDEDPLLLLSSSSVVDRISQESKNEACLYDGEIAALMAAEWKRQEGTRRQRQQQRQRQAYAKTRADQPWTWLETMACVFMAFLVGSLILGLCVYSIQHGSSSSSGATSKKQMGTRYYCPASSLEEIIHELNNRTQQEQDCHDFALPTSSSSSLLLPGEEVSRLELRLDSHIKELDVVFLGKLFDNSNNGNNNNDQAASWMDDSLYGIEIGRQGELVRPYYLNLLQSR
jgi:hypothetical protein